jgi:hypothetical protein
MGDLPKLSSFLRMLNLDTFFLGRKEEDNMKFSVSLGFDFAQPPQPNFPITPSRSKFWQISSRQRHELGAIWRGLTSLGESVINS